MKQSAKSTAALCEALSKEGLLGFDRLPGVTAAKAGLAKSGKAGQQKASVAKSGKSAAGKAASRPIVG